MKNNRIKGILLVLFALCAVIPPAFATVEVLYASDWTSSVTISSESNGYGAFNDTTAGFATFTTDGEVATAAVIDDTTGSGTLNDVSFEIRMSSDGGFSDDYFDIQYFDSGSASWNTVASSVQPVTSLTTYGPYDATLVTTFTEINNIQVRIIFERVKSADSISMNIDGVEVSVNFTPADTTPPEINFSAPANNTWDTDGTMLFQFTPYDASGIDNCTLYIDGAANVTNTSITNGVLNNISQSLADGTYLWSVQCIDSSTNNNIGYTTTNRTIKIDTTPPVVNLESPPTNNVSTESVVSYFYNVTDLATSIDECEMVVNDSIQDTTTAPAEDTSLNFTIALTNGFYSWWVNCTDDNGFETQSLKRNITINVSSPLIVSASGSYFVGETAIIDGENFNNLVGITTNFTLPNGTILTNITTSLGDGTFNATLYLNYSFPAGTYQVFSYQTNDLAENASTSFSVSVLPSTLQVNASTPNQGDEINISGLDFPPNDTINITLTFNDSSQVSFLDTINSTGGFFTRYNLSHTVAINFSSAFAYSVSHAQNNATTNFTIFTRVASVTTDTSSYLRDENVNVFGALFTRFGLSTLAIYDNLTDDIGASFPVNKTANNAGAFSHIWNTADTCNGVYRVEAQDLNNSYLNDTAFFTIAEFITGNDISLPQTAVKAIGTSRSAVTISNINTSNNIDETLTSGTKTNWYYEINFTNNYNPSLTITEVVFSIEHENSGTFGAPALSFFNGSAYEVVGCPALQMSTPEHTDECDMTSAIDSSTDLDAFSVRVTAEKTSGPTENWLLDYAFLNISTSYEPACFYFNGTPGGGLVANAPVIDTLLLEDNFISPANELDVTAGTTKLILCNVSASDGDGYTDILSVNATIYSNTVSLSSPDDNRTHYTNSSCALATGSGSDANYTCSFPVYYYAINGTWTCEAFAADAESVGAKTDTATMNQLYALNISQSQIDYGTFELGQTSLEQTVNVSNIGNARINVSAYGYGVTIGDGLAMDCDQNNLTLNTHRYALVASTAFAAKNILNESLETLGLFMDEQVAPGTPPLNSTYWQLQAAPATQAAGNCSGTVVFQAEAE